MRRVRRTPTGASARAEPGCSEPGRPQRPRAAVCGSTSVRPRRRRQRCVAGGVDVRDLAEEFGTPAYVLDEVDFRGRAVAFREAFTAAFDGNADVYYAGKAFLCTACRPLDGGGRVVGRHLQRR